MSTSLSFPENKASHLESNAISLFTSKLLCLNLEMCVNIPLKTMGLSYSNRSQLDSRLDYLPDHRILGLLRQLIN